MSETELFKATGDVSQLIGEFQKVIAQLKAEGSERRRNDTASAQIARAERARQREKVATGRAANKILEKQKTETDKYRDAVELLRKAHASGEISSQKLSKGIRGLRAELSRTHREKAANSAETRTNNRLQAEAERILERGKTAYDQHRQSVELLNAAHRKGRIDDAQRKAGIRQLDAELDAAKRGTDEYKAATKDASRIQKEAEKILGRSMTASDRYTRSVKLLESAEKKGLITRKQLAAGTRQLRTELKNADTGTKSWATSLGSTAGTITGVTGAAGGLLLVIAQLRGEYDRLIERQREAADTHRPLAAIQSQATKNIGQDAEFFGRADKFFELVKGESIKLGVDESVFTAAVSDALSARDANETARDALAAVTTAVKFERFGDADTLRTLAGSALDIGKRTGLNNEASLGFLSQIGQLSRVTQTDELSKNIAPAVVNALGSGASREFAGALVAAISQGIVDSTGRVSRTALTSVVTGLEKFGQQELQFALPDGSLRSGRLGGVEETLQALFDSPALADQFLNHTDGITFEKKALFAVRDLLQPGTAVNSAFEVGLQKLQTSDPQKQFDTVVAAVESLKSVRIATAEQRLKSTGEQLRLADDAGALSGVVREELAAIRKSLGRSGIGSKITGLLEDAEANGVQDLGTAVTALRAEAGSIFSRQRYVTVGGRGQTVTHSRRLTDLEKKQIELLTGSADALKKFRDQINAPAVLPEEQPALAVAAVPPQQPAPPVTPVDALPAEQPAPALTPVALPTEQLLPAEASATLPEERPATAVAPAAALPVQEPVPAVALPVVPAAPAPATRALNEEQTQAAVQSAEIDGLLVDGQQQQIGIEGQLLAEMRGLRADFAAAQSARPAEGGVQTASGRARNRQRNIRGGVA